MTPAEDPQAEPAPASEHYPALVRAVAAAERRHGRISDPLDRTVAFTMLIRALQEQLELVSGQRDQALIAVLAAHTHPSHRRLSTDLFLSRQRVDQLAVIARRGGRPRRE